MQLRVGGRDTELGWGASKPTHLNQTPNTNAHITGVSLRGISSADERETTLDHLLRSRSIAQSLRKLNCRDNQDVGLEAAII